MSGTHFSRIHPIQIGTRILPLSDFVSPARDERIVRPARRRGNRNA